MKSVILLVLLISSYSSISFAREMPIEEQFRRGLGHRPGMVGVGHVPGLRMGEPTYGGSGCPQGSLSTILTDDGQTLSVLYDEFVNELSGQKKKVRKNCQIKIPFVVPRGFQVTVSKVNYRGYNFLPRGGKTRLVTHFKYVSPSGVLKGKSLNQGMDFKGPIDEEYEVHALLSRRPMFSGCGEDFDFTINSSLITQTNGQREEAMSTIDSLDQNLSQAINYHLVWKKCGGGTALDRERERKEKERFNRNERRRVQPPKRGRGRGHRPPRF